MTPASAPGLTSISKPARAQPARASAAGQLGPRGAAAAALLLGLLPLCGCGDSAKDCEDTRKTSQGTQNHLGSEFVATILTVRATLRKQQRNILDFVIEACRARLQGSEPPSLLRSDRSETHHAPTLAEAA